MLDVFLVDRLPEENNITGIFAWKRTPIKYSRNSQEKKTAMLRNARDFFYSEDLVPELLNGWQ